MKLIAIFLLFLLPLIASADTALYYCNYRSYSNQEGNHKVKNKFELQFLVDKVSEKSYLIGKNGSSEVELLKSSNQLAFLEVTGFGNIMTTAIDSKLNSVHSRNYIGLSGEILPSQYYGKCEIK